MCRPDLAIDRHRIGTPVPIVVTLVVDDATQEEWDGLRRRWFPAERLVVGAHVTLFHALPGDRLGALLLDLDEVTALTNPFPLAVTEVRPLGHGVALRVRSPVLQGLHAMLADRWRPWLTPQDVQPLDAHVTVQNKVAPEVAQATLLEIRSTFVATAATATGIAVWRYLGGPWAPVATVAFR